METKTLCIVGACRNAAKFLPTVLPKLDMIASWWKECKVVIYENDSTDETSALLHAWKDAGHPIEIVQERNLDWRYPTRIERLAYIRNQLLGFVPPSFDYMLMVDLDDVFLSPPSKPAFESCFALTNWDVMTADSVSDYYDLWALRIPGGLDFDCWVRVRQLVRQGLSQAQAQDEAIEKYRVQMNKITEPTPVHSAFNIGILCKVSAIRPCCRFRSTVYDQLQPWLPPEVQLICEHIPFQTCLRSHGARIVFNPHFYL